MFNLESAITEWRRQMVAAGIARPTLLELESHLREEVERRVKTGTSARVAFEAAVKALGPAQALSAEFAQAGSRNGLRHGFMIAAALIAVGFIIWLSEFTFHYSGMGPGEQIVGFGAVAGSLLAVAAGRFTASFLPLFDSPGKRLTFALGCMLAGWLLSALFLNGLLPHLVNAQSDQVPALVFWGVFPIAVSGGLLCGISIAEKKQELQTA